MSTAPTSTPPEKLQLESTKDLRRFLLDRMQEVSDGELGNNEAKAICNLSQQIYNTINMEVKMAAAKSKYGGKIDAVKFVD